MRRITKGLLAGMMFCCMPLLAGCSVGETLGILWNSDTESETQEAEAAAEKGDAAVVDEKVEVPTITTDVGDPVEYGLNAEAKPITVEASVKDGGTLTYQWYANNVDSNGGGTLLEGETEASFTPPTAEPGTVYYYVVVTNTVDNAIQLVTSSTKSVTVTEEPAASEEASDEGSEKASDTGSSETAGTWRETDSGWWYEHQDGSYTKDGWEQIDGKWYAFDEDGYMRTGWFQDGDKWYYLNSDGSMATDTDVEGYHLGSDGVMEE